MQKEQVKSNFLTDIYLDSRSAFSDRLSSPLISTFLISWLISNYQAVLIFFADAEISNKIKLLNQHFYKPCHLIFNHDVSAPHWLVFGILIPALIAYLYVFQYPKIGNIFYLKATDNKLDLKLKQSLAEGKLLKTPEQVERIHIYYQEIEGKLKSRIDELENNFEAQESVIANLKKKTPRKTQSKKTVKKADITAIQDLSTDQIEIIDIIGQQKDGGQHALDQNTLEILSKLSLTKLKYTLNTLVHEKYLNEKFSGGMDIYSLDTKGLGAYIYLTNLNA